MPCLLLFGKTQDCIVVLPMGDAHGREDICSEHVDRYGQVVDKD